MTVKMAVFAPIPSAKVRIASSASPGDWRSWRKAPLKSFNQVCIEAPRAHHRVSKVKHFCRQTLVAQVGCFQAIPMLAGMACPELKKAVRK
jgi:hypothetical protein